MAATQLVAAGTMCTGVEKVAQRSETSLHVSFPVTEPERDQSAAFRDNKRCLVFNNIVCIRCMYVCSSAKEKKEEEEEATAVAVVVCTFRSRNHPEYVWE